MYRHAVMVMLYPQLPYEL